MAEESATLAWNAIVDQQVDRALGVLIEENITDLTASEQACSIFVGDASFILRTALV